MGLEIIDVALGLILVYLILSLVCTTVVEAISQHPWFRYRAKTLYSGLERMMGKHADTLLRHPEIRGLCGDAKNVNARIHKFQRVPSYIPSETFAIACLDVVESYEFVPDGIQRTPLQRLRLMEEVEELPKDGKSDLPREVTFARTMRSFWERAEGDRDKILKLIEKWFEDAMQRVSGNYRRWTQRVSFCVALIVVPLVNADTIRITRVLYESPEVRAQVAAQADAVASLQGEVPVETAETLKLAAKELRRMEPILGWPDPEAVAAEGEIAASRPKLFWLWIGVGWLVTMLAASIGAPFWFKVLNQMLRARDRIAQSTGGTPIDAGGDGGKGSKGQDGKPGQEPGSPPAGPKKPLDFVTSFEPGTIQHSNGNGYWLGKLAEVAYQDGPGFASALAPCQPKQVAFVSKKGTQAHIASWDGYAIVAFRGTEPNAADIATDTKFSLTNWDGVGQVHSGFLAALDDAWPALKKELLALGVGPEKSVWFTGHSLGGALAVLAASRCSVEGLAQVSGVYTIGQPRVGDEAFARDLDDRVAGRYFRYVNHRDAVPRVPLRAMKYHHTGKILYFDGEGKLDPTPSLWTRLLDVAFGGTAEVKLAVKEGAGDHSAVGYVECLRNYV